MNQIAPIFQSSIMRVMPENVTPLWPQIEAVLGPALMLVRTHTTDDVRRSVMAMRTQLWAQMDGDVLEAAATTEFVDYPVGMFVRVWLAVALKGRRFDDAAFFDTMDRWRDGNGCIGFEAIGRHGWLRRYPDARIEGLIMRWMP